MIVKGIAPMPQAIHDRADLPSVELVYLAKKALEAYRVTRLITSLEPGWEQALAKAAIEMEIPFTVILPYPARDTEWRRDVRIAYLDLLSKAEDVQRLADNRHAIALLNCHRAQIDRAECVLALWEYDFKDETFQLLQYGLKRGITVVNLWEDWTHLYKLRRQRAAAPKAPRRTGAQVFDRKN